VEVNAL